MDGGGEHALVPLLQLLALKESRLLELRQLLLRELRLSASDTGLALFPGRLRRRGQSREWWRKLEEPRKEEAHVLPISIAGGGGEYATGCGRVEKDEGSIAGRSVCD